MRNRAIKLSNESLLGRFSFELVNKREDLSQAANQHRIVTSAALSESSDRQAHSLLFKSRLPYWGFFFRSSNSINLFRQGVELWTMWVFLSALTTVLSTHLNQDAALSYIPISSLMILNDGYPSLVFLSPGGRAASHLCPFIRAVNHFMPESRLNHTIAPSLIRLCGLKGPFGLTVDTYSDVIYQYYIVIHYNTVHRAVIT